MTRFIVLLLQLLVFVGVAPCQDNYNEVTLPELMKKMQQGERNIVIVDVRSRGEYGDSSRGKSGNIGRIKGAINVVLQDLQSKTEAIKQLDTYRDKDIYLICSHSYRSRTASNILLKNGFMHVNNVRGGMTEWYRRYDELAPYREAFLEKRIPYNNLSPSQLVAQLREGKNILLLGIRNTPKFWWDSMNVKFYRFFPSLKGTAYFDFADSLNVLEEARKEKGRPVVLFNTVNNGAAELAEWLTWKGIPDVSYLVGGLSLLYEWAANQPTAGKLDWLFEDQSRIRFITPANYCAMAGNKQSQLIDIRHDSLFNKVNDGVKHDYKHLKNALNYFSGKGTDQFEKEFPDKKIEYVLMNEFGGQGIGLADGLTKKGYKIAWLIGGLDAWEWYMNNIEDFRCNDQLVDK